MPPHTPNLALVRARENLGWSRAQLARRLAAASPGKISFEAAAKAMKRVETGEVQQPTEVYRDLICRVLSESPTALFGTQSSVSREMAGSEHLFTVTCRKYLPMIVAPQIASALFATQGMAMTEIDGVPCARMDLGWPHDNRDRVSATVFAFGAVVVELRQTLGFSDLAELAVWRHTSYEVDRPRVEELLRSTWPQINSGPEYVLGTWWLARSPWTENDLDTAVRIMSTPSALLRRQGDPTPEQLRIEAEVAERAAWRDGFDPGPGLVDFGVPGVSTGYATWSGVAYAPVAIERALHPDELGDFETLCQGLWALCHEVSRTVESGEDPVAHPEYDWRWLRGVTLRITRPRPTETRQVRSMRDAVIDTSQLRSMLPETIELLRDAATAAL